MEKFSITRVVTKDLITDSFQGIRNLFGLRLRGYEKMLNKNIKEIMEVAEIEYKNEKVAYLNPTWVEWLMGYPMGYTNIGKKNLEVFQE